MLSITLAFLHFVLLSRCSAERPSQSDMWPASSRRARPPPSECTSSMGYIMPSMVGISPLLYKGCGGSGPPGGPAFPGGGGA